MKRKKPLRLKQEEREMLKRLLSRGKEKARKLTRCRILLLADEGRKDMRIMEALGTTRNTIKQVRSRYLEGGLEAALNEKPRSGAPPKFDGRQRVEMTAVACSQPPEGRNRWTLRLLADKAVELEIVDDISHMTIGRVLKKTNLSLT